MTDKEAPSSLAWMPTFINDTLALRARMSTLQFGALQSLRLNAWSEKPPCTLPDNDGALAAMSGLSADEWAANAFVIRRFLTPTEADASGPRLIDLELQKLYHKQFAKYVSAKLRGDKGGRPKAGAQAPKKQLEKLGETSGLQELSNHLNSGLNSSAVEKTDGDEAGGKPELPERPVAPELDQRQNDWLAKNPGKRLPLGFHLVPPQTAPSRQAEPVGPYVAADDFVNSEAAKREALEAALVIEYEQEIAGSLEDYRITRPQAYDAHYEESVKFCGYLNKQDLSPGQKARLEDEVLRRIREEQHWPSKTLFVSRRRVAIGREMAGA